MKKLFILFLVPIYLLYLYNITYKGEELYCKDVYVTSTTVYVKRINNKLLVNKKYEKNSYGLKNGNYTLYFKNGEYLGNKASKFNILRDYLDTNIKKIFNYNLYSYTKALLLYDKSYMEKTEKNLLSSLGISHIFSLSGFHLTLIYTFILMIFSRLSIIKRELISLFFITIYVLTIGFIPSITRAYILILILSLSKIFKENADTKKSFFIALLLTLAINPYQIINLSYILTYLVTYIIILTKEYNIFIKNIVIELVLLPIILYFFGSFNILMFIINIIFIPLFTVFIYLILITVIFRVSFLVVITTEYLELIRILMYLFSKLSVLSIKYSSLIFSIIIIVYFSVIYIIISYRTNLKNY